MDQGAGTCAWPKPAPFRLAFPWRFPTGPGEVLEITSAAQLVSVEGKKQSCGKNWGPGEVIKAALVLGPKPADATARAAHPFPASFAPVTAKPRGEKRSAYKGWQMNWHFYEVGSGARLAAQRTAATVQRAAAALPRTFKLPTHLSVLLLPRRRWPTPTS